MFVRKELKKQVIWGQYFHLQVGKNIVATAMFFSASFPFLCLLELREFNKFGDSTQMERNVNEEIMRE